MMRILTALGWHGYNLRNLTSTQCPECAQQLELGVRLTEPKQGWLFAGLVGLSAGAGLTGLLLIYGLIVVLFVSGFGDGLRRFFIINSLGFVVFGGGLFLWLLHWRRLRRVSHRLRSSLVIWTWLAVLAFVVARAIVLR